MEKVEFTRWKHVEHWTSLALKASRRGYITEADVEEFVERIFRYLVQEIGIPYFDIKLILQLENDAFLTRKKEVFSEKARRHVDEKVIELIRMIRIPDVSFFKTRTVDRILSEFDALSKTEKIEFLEKIKEYCL